MLLPLVTLSSPPTAEHIKSLLHLQVSSPVLLALLPEASRTAAGALAHAPLLDKCRVCAGPFAATEAEGAAQWLDGGALYVFFDFDVASSPEEVGAAVEALSSLPAYRVMVRIVGASIPAEAAGAGAAAAAPLPPALGPALGVLRERAGVAAFLLPSEGPSVGTPTLKALRGLAGSSSRLVLLPAPGCPVTASMVGALAKEEVDVAFPACVESAAEEGGAEVKGNLLCLGVTLAECIRSDRPDGLFTTVVADECGKLLGLVYSSKESLVLAIREMRGIYYSRSRKGIWRKGESSGNVQELLRVQLDCDCDALLFTVKQRGATAAFCHLLTRSCWGEEGGLSALERTLASRMVDAPAGSYTKRLFDDPELLRHKLMEEAQELSEATEPGHVAAEAADLIYFALVACTKAGVDLSDVEAHLNKRSLKVRRRPGNSKEFRVAAAAAFAQGLAEAKQGAAEAAAAAAGGGGGGGGSSSEGK